MERSSPYPSSFEDVKTIKDAIDFLNDLFVTQVEEAALERAEPNVAIRGDGTAKTAFYTLLPPSEQRVFFLKLIGDKRFWPRLRSLVGSPPYSFLRPEDEGVLRAAGITRNRAHMAHAEVAASNYGDFGKGHFEDGAGRLYRIISKERPSSDLPYNGLVGGSRVVADVRIQKRTATTKLSILRGEQGSLAIASLAFPRIGDTFNIRKVQTLRHSLEDEEPVRVRIEAGRQKAPNSPVARLVLKVE